MTKHTSKPANAARYHGPVGFVRLIADTVSEAKRMREEAMKRFPRAYIAE